MIPKNPFSKHQNVLFSEGETWKRLRSISSPTFSARKMKEVNYDRNTAKSSNLEMFISYLIPVVFKKLIAFSFVRIDVTFSKQVHRQFHRLVRRTL